MDATFQKCLIPFLFLAVNIVAGVLSMTVPSEEEQHTKAANMTLHPEFDPTFGSDDLCMIKVHFFHGRNYIKPIRASKGYVSDRSHTRQAKKIRTYLRVGT